MDKLYKVDSKSKIREWSIVVGKDSRGHYYEVSHGVKDGKMQVNRVYIHSGKNMGRSNETDAATQCLLEAHALHKKQQDRKGYSNNPQQVSKTKIAPMLAKKFQDEQHNISYPCAVQPKLDGVRTIAHITKNGVKLLSRQNKAFVGLDHITNELAPLYKKYGEIYLDGELFSKDLTFQEIASLTRKSVNLTDESQKIQYWVYDIINSDTFHQRYITWSNIILGMTHVKPTPTHIVKDEACIHAKHKVYIGSKFEGSMVRNLSSSYKCGARSSDLLKYKDFLDDEFEIIGFKKGKGKFENIPTFLMKTKEGYEFEGVPTGTQEYRKQLCDNAKSYIGKLATVRFFEYTTGENPVPRFPVIVDIERDDL
jgi:DNA ligase-1